MKRCIRRQPLTRFCKTGSFTAACLFVEGLSNGYLLSLSHNNVSAFRGKESLTCGNSENSVLSQPEWCDNFPGIEPAASSPSGLLGALPRSQLISFIGDVKIKDHVYHIQGNVWAQKAPNITSTNCSCPVLCYCARGGFVIRGLVRGGRDDGSNQSHFPKSQSADWTGSLWLSSPLPLPFVPQLGLSRAFLTNASAATTRSFHVTENTHLLWIKTQQPPTHSGPGQQGSVFEGELSAAVSKNPKQPC